MTFSNPIDCSKVLAKQRANCGKRFDRNTEKTNTRPLGINIKKGCFHCFSFSNAADILVEDNRRCGNDLLLHLDGDFGAVAVPRYVARIT